MNLKWSKLNTIARYLVEFCRFTTYCVLFLFLGFGRQWKSAVDMRPRPRRHTRPDKMVGETGIEPVTPDLEGPCSIQLSYSPVEGCDPSMAAVCVLFAKVASAKRIRIHCIDCSGAARRFEFPTAQQSDDVVECQLPPAPGDLGLRTDGCYINRTG
jgi:hypothetical protein